MSTRRHAARCAASLILLAGLPGASPAQARDSVARPAASPLDFSGLMFGNYMYRTDSATRAANGGQPRSQFNLDRVYLTFRMPAGEDASVRVTTDVFQQPVSGYYSGWTIRLKYAYVQFDFLHDIGGLAGFNAAARVGMVHTIAIDHYETFWPRALGTTDVEMYGFFPSSDLGAALLVTLPGKLGEAYATVTNGSGFVSAETNRFQDLALRLSLTPFASGKHLFSTLTISPWISAGANASTHQADAAPATLGPVSDRLRNDRWGILVGNHDRRLTVALDYGVRRETFEAGANTAASPLVLADSAGTVVSEYVSVRPAEWLDRTGKSPWGLLVRHDEFVPRTGAVGAGGRTPSQQHWVAGVFWDPNRNNTITLDYQSQSFSNYLPAAQPPSQTTWFVHWLVTF